MRTVNIFIYPGPLSLPIKAILTAEQHKSLIYMKFLDFAE